jgi:hypothetical protein
MALEIQVLAWESQKCSGIEPINGSWWQHHVNGTLLEFIFTYAIHAYHHYCLTTV